jgi:hypothetical protein
MYSACFPRQINKLSIIKIAITNKGTTEALKLETWMSSEYWSDIIISIEHLTELWISWGEEKKEKYSSWISTSDI